MVNGFENQDSELVPNLGGNAISKDFFVFKFFLMSWK